MDVLLPLLTLLIGLFGGGLGVLLWSRDSGLQGELTARGEDQAVITAGLSRLDERIRELDRERAAWQRQLHQQVVDMRDSADGLRQQTAALTTALRRPQVRGQWGEMHLRRSVELAGMVEHCDFAQQVHLAGDDGAARPDLVVSLAGGRSIVVDAKVPLDAYLDALATSDADEAMSHLSRHARQLRTHVDQLAAKAYWRRLPDTPEFVVLFVPSESFLSAACEADGSVLEYAATKQVVVATPTTLIALLRTVAHGWTTAALAERTREIHELGRLLHERIGTVGGHLDDLGRALKRSVESFNATVGSLESRVLVTARTFSDLSGTSEPLVRPSPVTQTPRALTAAELLEAVAEQRPELPLDGHGAPPRAEDRRDLA